MYVIWPHLSLKVEKVSHAECLRGLCRIAVARTVPQFTCASSSEAGSTPPPVGSAVAQCGPTQPTPDVGLAPAVSIAFAAIRTTATKVNDALATLMKSEEVDQELECTTIKALQEMLVRSEVCVCPSAQGREPFSSRRKPSPGRHSPPALRHEGDEEGHIRRDGVSKAVPEAVGHAVGGGCQSGWGRLLSVTNAIEAGTWRQGDIGWA